MAMALAGFSKVFADTYHVTATSNLGKAKCMVCHAKVTGGKLNAYGKDLKTAIGTTKKLTPANLKSVETKDSDGDGMNNKAEIAADRNPGISG